MKQNNEARSFAYRVIDSKIKEIEKILAECTKIADENNVEFSFSPVYGMGGSYDPVDGWISSSSQC
jgi:chaperonin cofactor prefoldin